MPAPIVRWHGRRRVERFLSELCAVVKGEDPDGLVTYTSHASTEYLELPFLDVVSWNVYLECPEGLASYLDRLHNLADERPLILGEIGWESARLGEQEQAQSVQRQLQVAFESGCAGAFVSSWTSEWFHHEEEVEDRELGPNTRELIPRPALRAVSRVFESIPVPVKSTPRVSVVVCSFNGESTIRDTLDGLARLEYDDYEVIVVDDGSTDTTPKIAAEYDVRLISTPNRGLSRARNEGMEAATGEIVAYIDDDAYPDPHWLTYLVKRFEESDFCGVGGPNLLPPEDGAVAECVALSPGGPCHVLLSDRVAEHIPGCNMAFRRSSLLEIGGFDPRFRAAGDDVDVCWRLQEAGGELGFHPAAVVWHHRRSSLTRYWKQQVGYGKAEALLARKWPQKYNTAGHIPWSGRIYGRGLTLPLLAPRERVYRGVWGSAPFQSIYQPAPGRLLSLTLMPEWFLLIAVLGGLTLLGASWPPLLLAAPLLVLAMVALGLQALGSAMPARLRRAGGSRRKRAGMRLLVAGLHVVQPAARLWGRLRHGLDPWRMRSSAGWVLPRVREMSVWTGRARCHSAWLEELDRSLCRTRALVRHGGDCDRWDLALACGLFGGARLLMAVEDHDRGRQHVRFRIWPTVRRVPLTLLVAALAGAALFQGAWAAGLALGAGVSCLAYATLRECGAAQAEIQKAVVGLREAGSGVLNGDTPQALEPAGLAVPNV
jgi:GT2 family glycosyltransferase